MRLLVIGGHFSPALSIIEELPKNAEVLYVGRKHSLEGDKALSLEYQTITSRNIPFVPINTGRLQRKWTKHSLNSYLKLPTGFIEAWKIIKDFKPTVILGFGSYVEIPLCIVGFLLGIPIVLHEQTLQSGLANRFIAPFAKKICVSWNSSVKSFPKNKVVLTGNPVVSSILKLEKNQDLQINTFKKLNKAGLVLNKKFPLILICGGSQGSHTLNKIIIDSLPEMLKTCNLIHQTGDAKEFNDYDFLIGMRSKLDPSVQQRYLPVKFFSPEEISCLFHKADLVISRAGMNTITALLLLQKPSLIIPLAVSDKNEQFKNSVLLKSFDLAEIILEKNLTVKLFLSTIHDMIKRPKNNPNFKDIEAINLQKDATAKIIHVLEYVQKNTSQTKT